MNLSMMSKVKQINEAEFYHIRSYHYVALDGPEGRKVESYWLDREGHGDFFL